MTTKTKNERFIYKSNFKKEMIKIIDKKKEMIKIIDENIEDYAMFESKTDDERNMFVIVATNCANSEILNLSALKNELLSLIEYNDETIDIAVSIDYTYIYLIIR